MPDSVKNAHVALVKCDDYTPARVDKALERALGLVGGMADLIKPGMRVLVKCNMVMRKSPDAAATTHPEVARAVCVAVRALGATPIIGDSPGGPLSATLLKSYYSGTGLAEAAQRSGAELSLDTAQGFRACPEGVELKRMDITNMANSADAVISCSKLKTHGMMGMTNAVKNFFGIIPGTMKPEYHYKYPKIEDFSDMIVDLCEYWKPRLCVCDAVVGMEGNGPTQGSARSIGCLIAAQSAHKLDLAACGLIGLMPSEVPTLSAAIRRGLCPDSAEKLTIFGDPAAFTVPDYKTVPSQASVFFRSGGKGVFAKLADSFLFHMLTPYPKLRASACVGCKKCANICPAKAITMQRGKPRIDRKACIHCFCCQEFCPKGAMGVSRPVIARLLNK